MRIRLILWVLAAFAFTNVLYAQGKGPGAGAAPQPQQPPQVNQPSVTQTQVQTQEQTKAPTQGKAGGPVAMNEKDVLKELKSAPEQTLLKDLDERGVDFEMSPGFEKKLRKAQASDKVVNAVRDAGPKERSQLVRVVSNIGTETGQKIPKEEADAFEDFKKELDPDKEIALVNDFIQKYPNSPLLVYAYAFGASSYQEKGDYDKVIDFSGKGLKLDPNNLMCLVARIAILPAPQYLKEHDAERDKILDEAVSEDNHTLELISKLPKPTQMTDADFQKRQATIASQVHGSLGTVHLERATEALIGIDKAELTKAETEYQVAVTTVDNPDPRDYYRLGEAYSLDGKLDDAIQAFTKASALSQGSPIKAYADQALERAKARKAQASAAPTKP